MGDRNAPAGLTAALRHVHALNERPDLIITGGDTIMDSFATNEADTTAQWQLFHKIMRQECSIPFKSCIGNHDVWGWDKEKSQTTGDEPLWGKKRAVYELKLPHRYYSFDQAGWHFIILDSTQPNGDSGYIAMLDDEQRTWLAQELKANPRPTCIVSHEPIISAAALLFAQVENGQHQISTAVIHTDLVQLEDLFKQHPHVKLCISGHLHLTDRVDYAGVTYLCNGAVCGAWWKGDHKDCDEGYAVIDLYNDGSFAHHYVTYNWQV
jgi:3',5'-cyclic AMP phosphodiesterase CpdA